LISTVEGSTSNETADRSTLAEVVEVVEAVDVVV
jgi:hypothetical protein